MDAFTLVVAAALAAVIMAGSMGLLYLAGTRRACLLDWTAAGLLFAASNVMGAIGMRNPAAPMLIVAFTNACHIAGHFGILAGVRRHLRLTPGWGWGMLLAAGMLAAHALPYMQTSPLHRALVITPIVWSVALSAVWLLWCQSASGARAAYLPLIAADVFTVLQQLVRVTVMVASDGEPPSFLGGQFMRTSGALSMLVFLSVATMGCALIVTHQQTLALRRASLTDVLTGWLNRRALQDTAAREFRRCRKDGQALFFIIFDIDHFKAVNDRYGHGVGDLAICHVTALAARELHGCDALFRIGGEEFAVLLAGAAADDVAARAERLRAQVAATPLQLDAAAIAMTVSVGIATMNAHDAEWDDILHRADEALYHAKQHGRDRVCVFGREPGNDLGRERQRDAAPARLRSVET